MPRTHLTACLCAIVALAPGTGRADLITIAGTVTSLISSDPAYAGLRPTAFAATGGFTPEFADRYGIGGTIAWTITLDVGVTLTTAQAGRDLVRTGGVGNSGLNFVDDETDHLYTFRTHLVSPTDFRVTSYVDAGAALAPSFVRVPPPPGRHDGSQYLAYLLSDLALGNVLPGTGTFAFGRGDGTYFTALTGTIDVLSYTTPEPATILAAIVGVALAAAGMGRRRSL